MSPKRGQETDIIKINMAYLTAKHLRAIVNYDSETGVFRWRVTRSSRALAGTVAGCVNRGGYLVFSIDYKLHYAHRLAWLYVHGHWPAAQIDHCNGDRADNRLVNLREATNTQNARNSRARASHLKGVWWHPKGHGRWVAEITVEGQRILLGRFTTEEAAHRAYREAARKHFGEFARFA